jgi:mono/diheme cytochrome c family protein
MAALRRLAALLLLGLAGACATSPGKGAVLEPNAADDDGARLYRRRCASCHRLHDPGERSAGEWGDVLERMAPKAHLSGADRAAVLSFLQAHARGSAPAHH